jgi:hypothetical protein
MFGFTGFTDKAINPNVRLLGCVITREKTVIMVKMFEFTMLVRNSSLPEWVGMPVWVVIS